MAEKEKNGKTESAGAEKRKLPPYVRYVVLACLGLLPVALGLWLLIAWPELKRRAAGGPTVDRRTAEEVVTEKKKKADEAEKTATWETFHCNLMHRYYQGPENDLPLAELLGLPAGADEAVVRSRCKELLPAVKLMGGFPSTQPQQDNFVVCLGFEWQHRGDTRLIVRPTAESLRNGEVLYGVPPLEMQRQKVTDRQTVAVGTFVITVLQADDRCIVLGARRQGRQRHIPGSIVRAGS